MSMRFRLLGIGQFKSRLERVHSRFPTAVEKALREEAEIEMTESKRRVPVDTGVLRASGHVTPTQYDGRTISVALVYGGAADQYAIVVHEDEEAFHKVGQAKYLESVLHESEPYMGKRIAARVNLERL